MTNCVCGFNPPNDPNPDCERCQLVAEVARVERENLHWGLWAESIGCTTDDDGNWVDQNGEYIPKVKGE